MVNDPVRNLKLWELGLLYFLIGNRVGGKLLDTLNMSGIVYRFTFDYLVDLNNKSIL